MIRERQKKECIASGKEWVAPEVQAAMDEEKFINEGEEVFINELKEKCEKKGKDYERELKLHLQKTAVNKARNEEKKRVAEEKSTQKAQKIAERQKVRLEKLSPKQKAIREEKQKRRAEKEELLWQKELKAGEIYRAKIKKEIEEYKA